MAVYLMSRPVDRHFLTDQELLFVEVPEKHVKFNFLGLFFGDSHLDKRKRPIFLNISDHKHLHFGPSKNFNMF